MTSSDVWTADQAQRYDSEGGMFSPDVVGPAVGALADLADGGRALEFAIGTGRIGVPLWAMGVPVVGIELSAPMVEQLRSKASEDELPVTIGDMATMRPGTSAPVGVSSWMQQATSHHLTRQEDGNYRRGTHNFRYVWPSELDLMARLAGMELEWRAEDWSGAPFASSSESHVSVWRLPG